VTKVFRRTAIWQAWDCSYLRFGGGAAIALMTVMAGAIITHLVHGEYVRLLSPLILGGLSYALYALQTRPQELP
jgi:hypothetical protein